MVTVHCQRRYYQKLRRGHWGQQKNLPFHLVLTASQQATTAVILNDRGHTRQSLSAIDDLLYVLRAWLRSVETVYRGVVTYVGVSE